MKLKEIIQILSLSLLLSIFGDGFSVNAFAFSQGYTLIPLDSLTIDSSRLVVAPPMENSEAITITIERAATGEIEVHEIIFSRSEFYLWKSLDDIEMILDSPYATPLPINEIYINDLEIQNFFNTRIPPMMAVRSERELFVWPGDIITYDLVTDVPSIYVGFVTVNNGNFHRMHFIDRTSIRSSFRIDAVGRVNVALGNGSRTQTANVDMRYSHSW